MRNDSAAKAITGDTRPMGVFGRVFLFLLTALATAGLLDQLFPNELSAVGIVGLAAGVAVVHKVEGSTDLFTTGLAIAGAASLLFLELFPSPASCGALRSRLVWLGEQQGKATAYRQACSPHAETDVNWCADHQPERSLEALEADRSATLGRVLSRCGGRSVRLG